MAGGFDLGGAFLGPIQQSQEIDQAKQLFPAQLAHTQALARLANAEAGKAEHDLSAEEQLARLMSAQGAPKPGEAPSATLARLSGLAIEAGSPTVASNLAMRAAQTATAEATKARSGVQQMEAQFKIDQGHQQLFSGLMADVHDQASWQRANGLYSLQTGEQSPLANMPYNPQAVQMLLDQGMKLVERKRLAMEAARLEEQRARDAARIGIADLNGKAYRAHLESEDETRAAKVKMGGKDIKAVTTQDSAAAMNLLENQMKDWFGSTPPEGQYTAAAQLAAETNSLMRKIPGLSADKARARALTSMMKSGDFQKHGGFEAMGGEPGTAIKLNAAPKIEDLSEGKWYSYNGKQIQYLGMRDGKPVFGTVDRKVPKPPADDLGDDDSDNGE
jgi:hypothetical protein